MKENNVSATTSAYIKRDPIAIDKHLSLCLVHVSMAISCVLLTRLSSFNHEKTCHWAVALCHVDKIPGPAFYNIVLAV